MRVSVVSTMRASPVTAMRFSSRAPMRATPSTAFRATAAAQLHTTAPVESRARVRKNLFGHHDQGMLPRMSWNVHNLYNILNRTFNPRKRSEMFFTRSTATVFQQRHKAKRFCRGYHGDWIQERRFKRYFVPLRLPAFNPTGNSAGLGKGARENAVVANQAVNIGGFQKDQSPLFSGRDEYASDTLLSSATDQPPMAQLFVRDVERGLDVVVFRACFAASVYKARSMILGGHVKLNGVVTRNPGILLEPGDLVQVAPARIPFLRYTEKELKKLNSAEKVTAEHDAEVQPAQEESEVKEEAKAEAEAENEGKPPSDREAAAQAASSEVQDVEAEIKDEKLDKATDEVAKKKQGELTSLPKGVRPFTQVPFAAWFLFVPPHLEVSWSTCSVIFMRYPTITVRKDQTRRPGSGFRNRTTTNRREPRDALIGAPGTTPDDVKYETDIGSPFAAAGDIYKLAWEWYQSNAPRTRGQLRRVRLMGKDARHGLVSSRALEAFHLTRALANNELVDRQSLNANWLDKMRQQHELPLRQRMLTRRQKLFAHLAQKAPEQAAKLEGLESPASETRPEA